MTITEMMKRHEWLASLKVGDEVAIRQWGRFEKGLITNVSPKRTKISVKNNRGQVEVFDKHGREMGSRSTTFYDRPILVSITDPAYLQYLVVSRRKEALGKIFAAIGDRSNRTFPNDEQLAKIRDDLTAFLEEQEK